MKIKHISWVVNSVGFIGYCLFMDYTINKRREYYFNQQKMFVNKLFR